MALHLRTIAATLLLAVSLAGAQTSPIVDLGYAQYQGAVNPANNITHFLGIRYAAAPLGDLRFRAPQPPVNMAGVQQATAQPNECFQAGYGVSPTNPLEKRATQIIDTEDCLFLNVYYPSNAAGTPPSDLPTLVWIHGGGYVGAGASIFNGEDIINQSARGVVVVIIQYRLGIFGQFISSLNRFLPGTAVKENGALNAGLRAYTWRMWCNFESDPRLKVDQDFALRWVNQHISKFGGNPAKVTIWGQSAGAGSVLQHVVANGGRTEPQLFRSAITSSTFLPSQYQFNDRIPELLFSEVVAQTNCTSATDALTCLRAVDATTLETANTNIVAAGFFGTFSTVPVVDGVFITQRPILSLLEGKVNGQALLSMTNTFEGTLFVNQSVVVTAAQYALDLFPDFGTAQANAVGALYANDGDELFQVDALQGDSIFTCPTYYLLNAFPGRSFKGEFAIPPGLHGDDILYYFPGAEGLFPPFNDTDFINAFAQSFTSFIINQDPNIKFDPSTITPHWNTFDILHTEMLFNKTADNEPVVHAITTSNALLKRCAFWNSVANLTSQ
ncbi:COesterase domain-containing protein [Mycena sanguinolenta]|uniref:Carboxylic ester hydrolase n=1 Tax=Mycena sanguinolenta TaxID=230812 RepID=A0A8H7DKA9_9AGAR|nr:COesterase domain-containing protein [Mycena sanguinolenta]